MKVRYIGQTFGFGVDGLTSDKVYECLGVELSFLRIVDDSEEDYLYSATDPGPLSDEIPPGKWEVLEDDEAGTLEKAVLGIFN